MADLITLINRTYSNTTKTTEAKRTELEEARAHIDELLDELDEAEDEIEDDDEDPDFMDDSDDDEF